MSRGKVKLPEPQPFVIVMDLGQFPVIIEEKKGRPGYVVLRCYVGGKQRQKAVGRMILRDDRGAIVPEATAMAKDKATAWYRQLTGAEAILPKAPALFTIGETWSAISSEQTGKYPHRTPFRDELERALDYAAIAWGSATPWTAIDTDAWTKLLRKRLSDQVKQGRTGLRSTEITVSRILTAVNWLKEKKRIPVDAALVDSHWRDAMANYWKGLTKEASIPAPFRPRHTAEESRALLVVAWDVDPRFGLLMALGAELRLGQVVRARRSELDLEANSFTVQGSGDKRGETIELTKGQRASVERAMAGYLVFAEAAYQATGEDYRLFPAGRLVGKKAGDPVAVDLSESIAGNTIRHWYRDAEVLAKVKRVPYRGAYGVRRWSVDAALAQNISEHGLKSLGGWSSGDMPRKVYADKENRSGRSEAASVRAVSRGET